MNKKLIVAPLIALSLVSALALSGCTPQTDAGKDPKPTSSSSPAKPTPSKSDKPGEVVINNSLELKQAEQAFPDVKATKNYTKQEVQLALLTANSYILASLDTPYFVDGNFAKDGYPGEKIDSYFKDYFSFDYWPQIKQKIAGAGKAANGDTTQQRANENLTALVFSTTLDPTITAGPECGNGGDCLKSLAPTIKYDSYGETEDGRLYLKASATSDPIYVVNGVKGSIDVTYSYELDMSKNDYADFSQGQRAFVISGSKNAFKTTGFKEDN